jgi:hypothetical protein
MDSGAFSRDAAEDFAAAVSGASPPARRITARHRPRTSMTAMALKVLLRSSEPAY